MLTETTKQSLLDLGIDPEDPLVLKALPLVYVAWADGVVVPLERSRVRAIAAGLGIGTESQQLIEHQLSERPSDDYFHEAFRLLGRVAGLPGELDVEPEDLLRILSWCEAVARVSHNRIGGPESVGPRERAALDRIAGALGLEPRSSFTDVLGDTDGAPELKSRKPPLGTRSDRDDEGASRETSLRRHRYRVRSERESDLPPKEGGLI